MRIYNATYKNVTLDWENVTLPINEGSPISADGKVSNDSDAIGLCPRYIWQEPLEDKNVPILIGGDVVLPEVEAEYGTKLTDDALASMGGINFYEDDGSIDKASGGGGDSGTLVLHMVTNEVPYRLDQTYKTIRDALADGKIIVLIFEANSNYNMWFTSSVATDPLTVVMFDPLNTENFWLPADSENSYPIWED